MQWCRQSACARTLCCRLHKWACTHSQLSVHDFFEWHVRRPGTITSGEKRATYCNCSNAPCRRVFLPSVCLHRNKLVSLSSSFPGCKNLRRLCGFRPACTQRRNSIRQAREIVVINKQVIAAVGRWSRSTPFVRIFSTALTASHSMTLHCCHKIRSIRWQQCTGTATIRMPTYLSIGHHGQAYCCNGHAGDHGERNETRWCDQHQPQSARLPHVSK